jgi:RNA 2',3'-cyclic 3'-phosphodiesterase
MNRLFLALPVTIFDYQSLQDDFEGLIKGKWTIPQNLHLTLSFFGNIFEKEFLIKTLSTRKLQIEPSALEGLSLLMHNKILYAPTQNDSLLTLHTQIREALMLPSEQEFIPHVTLMRIKKINHPTRFEQKLKTYDKKIIGTLQPRIQLIQSQITATGAQYTLLKEFGS